MSSRSSSPPPRPAYLAIPTPAIPLAAIPDLLGWSIIVTYALPNSGFAIADDVAFTAPVPPRWTLWLESWYQAFCPILWQLLEKDEKRDNEVNEALMAYRRKRAQEGAAQEELDLLLRDRSRLNERRYTRRARLYGLHAARRRYMDYRLAQPSKPSEADVLRDTEAGDLELFCPFAVGEGIKVFEEDPYDPEADVPRTHMDEGGAEFRAREKSEDKAKTV
ncbi:hypothetical protein JCM10213_001593 [Rhodosporidiobolus nylandii]